MLVSDVALPTTISIDMNQNHREIDIISDVDGHTVSLSKVSMY